MATWGNVSGPWRLSIGDNEPGLHPILSFLTFLVPPPKQNPEYLPLVPISNYQPFTHVPNEILCEIASFLPVRDFTSFICTSKRHGQLDKEDSIWKGLCMRDFGAENVRNSIFTHFNKNWKWVYQSKKIVFKSRKSIKDGSVGTYLSKKGRCEGEWKGKRLHGYGILYAEETGNIIEGEWINGVGHGFTRLIYKSGDVYAGQWQNGVLEGQGICYFAQGSIYKGQWKDNHVHGEGTCWFPDGRYHKGQWVAGEKHGEGVCTFADGHQFKAKWKHNKPGKGTLICPKTGIALKTHWTREFACCSKASGIN